MKHGRPKKEGLELSNGVPGVNGPDPKSYEEFWPYYVSQHLHPATRAIHVAGTTAGLACAAAAALTLSPLLLAAAPVVGYGAAWTSHFTIEKNKPASFGHPLWSARADMRLLWKTYGGRIADDVGAVRRALAMRPDQHTLADLRAAA